MAASRTPNVHEPAGRRRRGWLTIITKIEGERGDPSDLAGTVGYRTSAQRVTAIKKVGVDNGSYEKYGESRKSPIQKGFLPLSMP